MMGTNHVKKGAAQKGWGGGEHRMSVGSVIEVSKRGSISTGSDAFQVKSEFPRKSRKKKIRDKDSNRSDLGGGFN